MQEVPGEMVLQRHAGHFWLAWVCLNGTVSGIVSNYIVPEFRYFVYPLVTLQWLKLDVVCNFVLVCIMAVRSYKICISVTNVVFQSTSFVSCTDWTLWTFGFDEETRVDPCAKHCLFLASDGPPHNHFRLLWYLLLSGHVRCPACPVILPGYLEINTTWCNIWRALPLFSMFVACFVAI